MNCAGKNSAEYNPQIHTRTPHCSGDCTKNRAKAGDVQQLDEERFGISHRNIVDAVRISNCRRRFVCYGKNLFYDFTVNKITHNEQGKCYKESYHFDPPVLESML